MIVASDSDGPAFVLKDDVQVLRHQVILVSTKCFSDTDLPLLFSLLLQLCWSQDACRLSGCLERSQPLKCGHIARSKFLKPTLSPVVGPHCPLLQNSPGGGADQRLLIVSLLNHPSVFEFVRDY